eukprot:gnl/MRDRNA2_/MRDRNA2_29635_c0_seq2.p1 gnl/MRDRNA2_/MRDRNA2_29635_c0~~gnl/MRDRNA2_/MRDRNA2_29635_c0_seq2.p1  ORF type:complete len:246 (+),score=45.56 gnl/MRDRNA2_/MRDRNA2_29635_c0_seq2:109-846(+)
MVSGDNQHLMGGGPQGRPGGAPPKLNPGKINVWWFAAACAVVIGGVIGTLDLLFTTFAPLDLIDEIYLLFFGLIMFTLDAPLNLKFLMEVKTNVHRYAKFLTLLVGRGIWYIFLGTMTFATLWENNISPFLAVILGFFVFGIGVYSTVFGFVKTRKLEKVRVQVAQNKDAGKLEALYKNFARTAPQLGLTRPEFNDMAQQLKGIAFDPDDLFYIFKALSLGPTDREENIDYNSFSDWANGGMALL